MNEMGGKGRKFPQPDLLASLNIFLKVTYYLHELILLMSSQRKVFNDMITVLIRCLQNDHLGLGLKDTWLPESHRVVSTWWPESHRVVSDCDLLQSEQREDEAFTQALYIGWLYQGLTLPGVRDNCPHDPVCTGGDSNVYYMSSGHLVFNSLVWGHFVCLSVCLLVSFLCTTEILTTNYQRWKLLIFERYTEPPI